MTGANGLQTMLLYLLIMALLYLYSERSLLVSGELCTTILRKRQFSSKISSVYLKTYFNKTTSLAYGSVVSGTTLSLKDDFIPSNDLTQNATPLSDCKSNIAIFGSFMVTALLASTDDEVYQTRQGALEEFRRLLQRLEERYDFAALPLLRLNLLLERFSERVENLTQ